MTALAIASSSRGGGGGGRSSQTEGGSIEVAEVANKLVFGFTEKLVLILFSLIVIQAAADSLTKVACSQKQLGLQVRRCCCCRGQSEGESEMHGGLCACACGESNDTPFLSMFL